MIDASRTSPRPLRRLGFAVLALAAGFLAPALGPRAARGQEAAGAQEKGWIALFNGKDLEGWTPKIRGYPAGENYADTFRVEDGMLKVKYDKYRKFDGKYGHLFYKTPYSSYRLRIEYRFVGEQCPGGQGWALRNSGVMIHGQSPETMRKDQDFPVSIEVQFLGGTGRETRHTANVCTPGTNIVMNNHLIIRHCTESDSKTYHGDQWVTVEVEVHGHGTIRHYVEDKVVLEYEQPQLDVSDADARKLIKGNKKLIDGGTISLQSESHPIEFRKVALLPLND